MEDTIFTILKLLATIFLVLLNGLFVAAEFSFTKLRSTRVESMVQEGKASAGLVREATQSLDRHLAVCQVGITLASLGLGALGEPAVATLITPLLGSFLPEAIIHTVAFAVAFGIITFLHVTYGELASKSFAIAMPEGTSQFVAPFMKFFYYLFRPAIWLFNGTANLSVSIFGIPPASETEERHSEEELHMLVSQSKRQGFLEDREAARVRAAFDLDEKVAREVMVPKTNAVAFPAGTGLEKLFSEMAQDNRVRCPISEDDYADRIIGTVHVKDVLRAIKTHGGIEADVSARDIMHDVLTVPENRPVDGVLDDLQEKRLQMAVVVDEWGSCKGLITIEDILKEIVGDIREEWEEEPEPDFRGLGDGAYAVKGHLPIRDVNDLLNTTLTSEDFGTIGGLILGQLGRAPKVGDEVVLNGYELRVEEVDGSRVARIVVRKWRGNEGGSEAEERTESSKIRNSRTFDEVT